MAHLWRVWKYRVERKGYYAYKTDEERLANCPPSVVQEQWINLVAKWGKEDEEEKLTDVINELSEEDRNSVVTVKRFLLKILVKMVMVECVIWDVVLRYVWFMAKVQGCRGLKVVQWFVQILRKRCNYKS